MRYIVMFLDKHSGRVGISAVWGEGSRWVRFYGDESKDYPRPVAYETRKEATSHAKLVINWIKRNQDGIVWSGPFSYKILPIRDAKS